MINSIIYFFIIGSFMGWILELGFKTIAKEDLSRAGMADGPFSILYGFGTLLLVFVIGNNVSNIFLLYILCSIVLTTCEYIGAIILEKVFGIELWDYTKLKFGINKHISLEFIFLWGFFGILFIKLILPFLNQMYNYLYSPIFFVFMYSIFAFIVIDYIYVSVKLIKNK